eukprot:4390099-Pleurochrysis_carterae.AAC.3
MSPSNNRDMDDDHSFDGTSQDSVFEIRAWTSCAHGPHDTASYPYTHYRVKSQKPGSGVTTD